MLSAIIPVFNEMNNEALWANVDLLTALQDVELIVVDGGSNDGTVERLRKRPIKLIEAHDANRAERFNRGIAAAAGEMILLIHPRSRLSPEGLQHLIRTPTHKTWGAFRHRFDWAHPLLHFTSWYSNSVRGRRGIYYLDHCLFFSADLKGQAHFPDVSIFEDTHFCRRLRKISAPIRLDYPVVTSAVRFRQNGVYRQSLLNQTLKLLFYLGVSEERMNRVYERGLWLNSKF